YGRNVAPLVTQAVLSTCAASTSSGRLADQSFGLDCRAGAWFALCNQGRGTRQTHRRTTMPARDGHIIVGVESSRSRSSRRIEVCSVIATLAVIAATVLIVSLH